MNFVSQKRNCRKDSFWQNVELPIIKTLSTLSAYKVRSAVIDDVAVVNDKRTQLPPTTEPVASFGSRNSIKLQ
jgi:hypothetical protein